MKQLKLFEQMRHTDDLEVGPKKRSHIRLFVDGAARNNPGPAGAGLYIIKDNLVVEQQGFYLGVKTNNQAEYLALLIGLYFVRTYCHHDDFLEIVSDSQLLVRQIQGAYKVRHPDLQPLFRAVQQILRAYDHVASHVMRDDNTHADALANKGIDEKIQVPQECKTFLAQYSITL